MEYVMKFPDKPWSWEGLSCNLNTTMEFVMMFPDKPWDWFELSRNSNITMEHVLSYPDLPWDYYSLSSNEILYANPSLQMLSREAIFKDMILNDRKMDINITPHWMRQFLYLA